MKTLSLIAAMFLPLAGMFPASGATQQPPVPAVSYTVIDLGPLGGNLTESVGRGVNDFGVVTGRSYREDFSEVRATLWFFNSHPLLLRGGSSGYGINNYGQIIGDAGEGSEIITDQRAVFWANPFTHATNLASPANLGAIGLHINAHGQMVGNIYNDDGSFFRAVFWANSHSQPVQLAGLPGLPDSGLGGRRSLNDAGQIVGEASDDAYTEFHATFWASSHSPAVALGGPGGAFSNSQADAINNHGQIVGEAFNADFSIERAVFWRNSHSAGVDFGALGSELSNSEAQGINDRGQIVGHVYNADDSVEHAVLWPNGHSAAIDLNAVIPANSGWLLQRGIAINQFGVITGHGVFHKHTHGFALIPRFH